MGRRRNNNSLHNHLIIGVFTNLISAGLLVGGYFVQKPVLKIVTWAGAILVWVVLACIIKFLIRPNWRKVRKVGYYFILTWPLFWILDQRKRRIVAEKEVSKLKEILEALPAANTAQKITRHTSRKEGLEAALNNVKNWSDSDLTLIIRSIHYYAEDIWESTENGRNYNLFRELMERLSLCKPNRYPQTNGNLLWLFFDIYEMQQTGSPRREVQKDMIVPLKHVIWRVDEAHLNVLRGVIKKIMLDKNDDNALAYPILEMLLTLNPKTDKSIWQLIFDECKERAFIFPERFGHDFMHKLSELKYKVFWLNFHSLRDIWTEPAIPGKEKLLISQQPKFNELCSTIFAAIEDLQHSRINHGRVFRRLPGDAGKVTIECILPNGNNCRCEGQSMSFRGIYSKDCLEKVTEKLKTKITPLLEHNRQLNLTSSVAQLHNPESSDDIPGRGIFFENTDEETANSIYQYISQH